jgi:hypothetical protein
VQHRAEALGPPIEAAVDLSGIEALGDGLGPVGVGDPHKKALSAIAKAIPAWVRR